MFVLICGYLPFDDENMHILYGKIISGTFSIPSFVSEEGTNLIKCILNTDPMKRYTINQIFQHPWFCKHKKNIE